MSHRSKIDRGDLGEENGGQQRKPDVEDEAELRLVQSHWLFEVGVRVDEIGGEAALVRYAVWKGGQDTRLASSTVRP